MHDGAAHRGAVFVLGGALDVLPLTTCLSARSIH